MRKVKDFFKNLVNFKKDGELNKPKTIVAALMLVVVIVLVVVLVIPKGNKQEKELTAKLQELGAQFYEGYYHKAIGSTDEERANNVKKFANIGIKVDLENLIRFNSDDQDALTKLFVNNKTDAPCDQKNTKITIYPEGEFGEKDYRIEVQLACGFEDGKKEDKDETTTKKTEKATTTTTTTTKKTTKAKSKK